MQELRQDVDAVEELLGVRIGPRKRKTSSTTPSCKR
jgi:hypothetical protein